MLAQRLSMVSGVAQVNVFGAQKYAVRIDVDPTQLAARQIGIDQVARGDRHRERQPADRHALRPATQLRRAGERSADGRAGVPAGGRRVSQRQPGPARARSRTSTTASRTRGTPAGSTAIPTIYLAIQRQPGTNTVEVVDAIKALLPQLQAQLPAALSLGIRSDRSVSIRESVHDVKFTLLLTVFLVVLVIFLFLRNLSATIIPSLALPFSIVGTFAVMWALDYSLDNLSLMALTLSVGFVVDDAIVMLENIVRHMEMGKTRMQASLDGSKEIAFTIVSMTLSLAAVFIPVLFMGGIVGRLMHEFAVTIAASILVSGLVSLTLTPMLCSRFLKPLHGGHHGSFYNVDRAHVRGLAALVRLDAASDDPVQGADDGRLGAAAGRAPSISSGSMPKGFIPSVDTGQLNGQIEAIQGIGYESMVGHSQAGHGHPGEGPERRRRSPPTSAVTGARLNVDLKPRDQRTLTADQIIDELRPKLARVPGVRVFLTNPPAIRIGGFQSRSQYQYTLQDPDTDELYRVAPQFEAALHNVEGIEDVNSDLQIKNPQVTVDLDREQIAALGLTVDQVESALTSAYGSRQVSQIFAPNDEYQVIMQVAPQYQQDPAALSMLYVQAPGDKLVPLSAVVTTRQTVGPLSVNHTGQLPSVTLSFNLQAGRGARRRGRRASRSWRARRCRRRYQAASRARRRRSRSRCRVSAGFSRSRSS